jgi:hypothetical protein
MTIASTTSRTMYVGAGSVGPYAVPFRLLSDADVRVVRRSAADAETVLVLDVDYTVAGLLNATATITLTTALAVGETLSIRRAPSLLQPTSIQNQGSYFPKTHEDEFDRLVMQVQSLQDQLDRSAGVIESIDPATLSMRVKPETGKALVWQSSTVLGNATLDSSAIALPGEGRTVVTVSAYLLNNRRFNPRDYGASGDGVANDRAAFLLCDAAALAAGASVFVPAGTYKIATNMTLVARTAFDIGAQFSGAGVVTWDQNLSVGYKALGTYNVAAVQNTVLGVEAMPVNTTGWANVAVGFQALPVNTTGYTNTAIGTTSMFRNTTGFNNTAVGVDTLQYNTAGDGHTAVGSNALGFGDGGHSCTAVGWRAAWNAGGTIANTAMGLEAMQAKTSGNFNAAYGASALNFNTTGTQNVAMGPGTLLNNIVGSRNIALGYLAGAYELGSDTFYVDNRDRLTTAGDKANALLYGTFNAAGAASQTLKVNAAFTVNGALVTTFGAKAGSFQQAAFGTSDALPIQLLVNNATNVAMELQSLEQGVGGKILRLNPAAGAVEIASAAVPTTVKGTFGCNGAAAQAAFVSGGAAPAGGVGTAAGGWDTAAHRDAAITLLNNIRSALVANGIMS